MTKVTAWGVKELNKVSHNHIENGWVEEEKPNPKFPTQKAWKRQNWRKQFCWLINNKVEPSNG